MSWAWVVDARERSPHRENSREGRKGGVPKTVSICPLLVITGETTRIGGYSLVYLDIPISPSYPNTNVTEFS